jgi:hypothetical protein
LFSQKFQQDTIKPHHVPLHVYKYIHIVTVWGRFNALYIRLYIVPHIDLWVLQGVTIIEGINQFES